jgi:hypothetical protein
VITTVRERFARWTRAEIPGGGVRAFRVAFAAIWLTYDVLDLCLRGTAINQWIAGAALPVAGLVALQLGLVVSETGLLFGVRARRCALAAAVLRAAEAYYYFRLNDFYYFAVVALILSQCRLERGSQDGGAAPELAWPRDVLLAQTAWIYFATAALKTSAVYWSGGHLYVRHQYLLSAFGWPYPVLYRAFISTLAGNAFLARLGVLGELTLAALIALRAPKRPTVALAVALHLYAAVALNVYFFGASMIAQVACLLPARKSA